MDEIFISFDGSARDNTIKLAEKIEKLMHYKVFIDKNRGKVLQENDPENEIEEKIKNVRKVILYLTKEYIENLPHKKYLLIEIKAIQDRIKKEGRKFLIILKDNKNTELKNEIINDDVFEIFDDFLNDEKKLFNYLRRSEKFDIEKIKNKIYEDVKAVGERYLPFVNENIKNIEIEELEKIEFLDKKVFNNYERNLLVEINEKIKIINNIINNLKNSKLKCNLSNLNNLENTEALIKNIDICLKNINNELTINNKNFELISRINYMKRTEDYNYYKNTLEDKENLQNLQKELNILKELIYKEKPKYILRKNIYFQKKLLLIGEALIGKTHFLSNLALERINQNKPTLLFYGENLRSKTLIQSLKDNLELSDLTDEEFFNEIDLWGKDLNERVFIIIDAINETPNLNLWRNDLSRLCNYVKKYENIALILSVRDVEKEKIISDKNRHCFENEFIEIQHPGFEGIEAEAISKYCKAFKIDLPKIPFHTGKIFVNPGMLYIFIKAIKELNIEYKFNYINPLKIFNLYRKSLEKKFADKYEEDVDLDEETIKEGIDTIIKLGLDLKNFEFEINYKKAIKKINPIHQKLLDFLVSEGLFRKIKKEEKTYIRFTYQKFENFYIINYILENDPRLINSIFETNNYMLLEALFSLYPQKYKKEIYENYPDVLHYYFNIYKKSLYFRDPNTITEKTLKDIKEVSYESYIELLIYFSIYPNHKFNDILHDKLLNLELAIRDRDWTITINNIFLKENNLIKQIINWTIKNNVPDESRKYYGKLLAWFLTSTNRELRDKAIKALVNLYTNHLCEFLEILKEFKNINDLYILERLYAALYGIVLRSEDKCFIEIADYVYKTIFNKEYVIEHVLIREYASLTIKHILKFIKLDIDIQKINPPYNQHKNWTLLDISKEEVDE